MVGTLAALALVLTWAAAFLACLPAPFSNGIARFACEWRSAPEQVRDVARVRDFGWMFAPGAVGMVLAGFSGRLVTAFRFGVDPLDPLTFVSVPVVILLTAVVAAAPRGVPAASTRSTR